MPPKPPHVLVLRDERGRFSRVERIEVPTFHRAIGCICVGIYQVDDGCRVHGDRPAITVGGTEPPGAPTIYPRLKIANDECDECTEAIDEHADWCSERDK